MRAGGTEYHRRSHTPEIAGSTPAPATTARRQVSCADTAHAAIGMVYYKRQETGEIAHEKEREMTVLHVMNNKQHEHKEKRFWFCQERSFVMPVLEKQSMHYSGAAKPGT